MRTLYIDCQMGAAGDMLTAALLELLPHPEDFLKELNTLGISHVKFQKKTLVKCGITGTHITVTVDGREEGSYDYHHHGYSHEHSHEHNHHHELSHEYDHHEHEHNHMHSHRHHNSLYHIEHIVREHLVLPQNVQDDIIAVYNLIAEAESHVHGVPVSKIHFHEVGTMDALADITAVCLLLHHLAVDKIIVSPIHVGSGQVKCAHGILPVPAPATAYILQDTPIYGGSIAGELCTPTGAALLKHFAAGFGNMPVMKIQAIGYGMGTKDFEAANCVRVMLGETSITGDEVWELSCNIDDMTGEAVGFAMERLFEAGALDVYTIPIGMKKSRPGILLQVMCHESNKEAILHAMFKHTTTIGIRENKMSRYVLDRRVESKETIYGPLRCKISSGYGVERKKYEYEDLNRIAREHNISIENALRQIK